VKLTFAIVVFLGGTAAADSVTLSAVPTSEPLPLVSYWSACSANKQRVQTTKLTLDGHDVAVLHQCTTDPQVTEIAFEAANATTWHLFESGTVKSSESTILSKLKDGRQALLHRLDSPIAGKDPDAPTLYSSRVDICAYDKKSGAPQCGVVEVQCPETGCQKPEILKGSLWIHAKGGRKKFDIK
jgi:hypothetical protein